MESCQLAKHSADDNALRDLAITARQTWN